LKRFKKSALGLFFALIALIAVWGWQTLNLFLNQDGLLYHPDAAWQTTPADSGLDYEDVTFVSADGLRLSAWWVKAPDARGTVLLCHGNAGNISHRLDETHVYQSLGFNVLVFDYRGYGKSQGKPSEAGTYADAEAAWRYLVEERRVLPSDIVLCGRSLGAAIAVKLAADHRPRALVIESGFTSLADLASELYPWFPVRQLLKFRYETLNALKEVRSPVLLVHSRQDKLVPFHHGQTLYAAARPPKKFLEISGPHNEGYQLSEDIYRQGLKDFLYSPAPSSEN